MARRGLDVLVVGQPANREYLSGFREYEGSASASAGWVVLTSRQGWLVTGFNYFSDVESKLRHLTPVRASSRLLLALVDVLNGLPPGKIGIEGDWLTVSVHAELATRLETGRELLPADGIVEGLRATKNHDEIEAIRRAIRLTDAVYIDVVAGIRIGQTERDIAWAIERQLRERGADGMAFGPSVAAGPNSAVPHHTPSDYQIRPGDAVWIDLGSRLDGYCADLTRSFAVGDASPDYLGTWHLTLQAQETAITGIRADVTAKDADALARNVVVAAGRGEEFGHPLGHGIGLMIHEAPLLAGRSSERLESGMIVTVEPGLYRAGWGGVRIEDVALIAPDGALILSEAPKAPLISGAGR